VLLLLKVLEDATEVISKDIYIYLKRPKIYLCFVKEKKKEKKVIYQGKKQNGHNYDGIPCISSEDDDDAALYF